MESLLTDEVVLLRLTRITTQKGINFWSDHWITLKFLEVFPNVVFLRVAMESLLIEEEV
jgi:hypothetical protein